MAGMNFPGESRAKKRSIFEKLEKKTALVRAVFFFFVLSCFALNLIILQSLTIRNLVSSAIVAFLAGILCYIFVQRRKAVFASIRNYTAKRRVEGEMERFLVGLLRGLRLPVAGMKYEIKAINNNEADPEIKDSLRKINQNVDRIDRFSGGLLKLGRLRKISPNFEIVDMNVVLKEATEEIQCLVDEKNATVQAKILSACYGDKDLLRILLVELLKNAIIYGHPKRDPVVRVWSRSLDGKINYFVEDNGIGIDAEYFEKIFEIFYRIRYQNDQCQGIGLSLVKRILEAHHGRVWLSSGSGGSVFSFAIAEASE